MKKYIYTFLTFVIYSTLLIASDDEFLVEDFKSSPIPQSSFHMDNQKESPFTFSVYNVGQGNFLVLYASGDIIIIDCGSSSYKREHAFERQTIYPIAIPSGKVTSDKKGEAWPIKKLKGTEDSKTLFIKNIKENYTKKINNTNMVRIKTVVVTHADEDHYGWLPSLLNYSDPNVTIEIDHIILGGLPVFYGSTSLMPWLLTSFEKNTTFYLPAILDKKICIENPTQTQDSDTYYYSASDFSSLFFDPDPVVRPRFHGFMKDLFMKDAFDIPDVETTCLGANTMHISVGKKTVYGLNHDEKNADSIALKFAHKDKSVICMGDCEGKNLKVIEALWEDYLDMLKCTVFVANHHGSYENGCNDPRYLALYQPRMVVFSHGITTFGHPRQEVYKFLRNLNSLSQLEEAKIMYFGVDKKEAESSNRYMEWHVFHAYFSTLLDGNIFFNFDDSSTVSVKTDRKSYSIEIDKLKTKEDPVDKKRALGSFIEPHSDESAVKPIPFDIMCMEAIEGFDLGFIPDPEPDLKRQKI